MTEGRIDAPRELAAVLAGFVRALWEIDASGGPPPGEHNSWRGAPLARRDARVRSAIEECRGMVDAAVAMSAWESAVGAPVWDGPPRWLHGDLLPGNLLVRDGKLSAVIDFGCLGVGDPAVDLLPAWAVLEGEAREVFRASLDVDEAMWERGRGWALSFGLIALPYYVETNPVLAGVARASIEAVLGDSG